MLKTKLLIPLAGIVGISTIAPVSTLTSCGRRKYDKITEPQWQSAMDKLMITDLGAFPCVNMASSEDHITVHLDSETMSITELEANYENIKCKYQEDGKSSYEWSHHISDGIAMGDSIYDHFVHLASYDFLPIMMLTIFANFCCNLFPHFTYDKDNIYHFNADLEEVLHVSADFGFASKNLTYVRIDGWMNMDEDPEPEVLLDVVAHLDYTPSKISLPDEFSEAIKKQNFNCKEETYTFDVKGGSYTKDDSFSIHFTNIPEGSTKLTVYDGDQPATTASWNWTRLYVGKNGLESDWWDSETFEKTSNSITFKEPLKSTDSITVAFEPNADLSNKKYTFKWS